MYNKTNVTNIPTSRRCRGEDRCEQPGEAEVLERDPRFIVPFTCFCAAARR
jgi:hypothetical protein